MSSFNDKDSNNIIHAMVVVPNRMLELMGKDLNSHFIKHKVSLVNVAPAVTYGEDAITLVLSGKQNDIKTSLSQLRKMCFQREIGLECSPVRSLPPTMKGYLSDMEDSIRFEKLFSYCSKEYLEYCKSHNISPHPEVVEASH